jgi:RNA polymerase sigma factor (sigma-70 family)
VPYEVVANGLYQRHYSRVLGFCRNRLRTREDAEDAAQTTFTYAVGALQRGVVPEAESAWLLKIARNVCLNRWAANSRRDRIEVVRDPHVLQDVAVARESGDDELTALQEALARLTEQQRRAIVLREFNGLSYEEIARELGVSRGAVETLIFRARRSLARQLRGNGRVRSGIDLGSLLTAFKSLLGGGGAALKIALGVAALATAVGVAVPRLEQRPNQSSGVQKTPSFRSASPTPVAVAKVRAAIAVREHAQRPRDASVRDATVNTAPSGSGVAAAPSAPAAPAASDPVAPAAAPAPAAPAAPSTPSVPEVPAAPQPATSPAAAPSAPAIPAVPAVPVAPAVPSAPSLPQTPALPTPPVAVPAIPVPPAPQLP